MATTDNPKGTDSLKSLILFLTLAVQKGSTIDTNGDRKVSFMEAISLITTLGFKIPMVANSFPHIHEEWKDLTPEEMDELVKWFATEFDLPMLEHAKLEAVIKKSIQILLTNYNYYREMRAILG